MITGLGGISFNSGSFRISSRLRSRCGGSRGLGGRSRRRCHSRRGSRRLFVEHDDRRDFAILTDAELVLGIVNFIALGCVKLLVIILAKVKRKLANALRVRATFLNNIAIDVVDPETGIGGYSQGIDRRRTIT